MTTLHPDQLCTVVGPAGSRSLGWLVRTMHTISPGLFKLPDGSLGYNPFKEITWLCESMVVSDFELGTSSGRTIHTRWAGFRECWLKPLPGPETLVDEETADHAPAGLEFEDLTA